jgi:hypothetical protein
MTMTKTLTKKILILFIAYFLLSPKLALWLIYKSALAGSIDPMIHSYETEPPG